MPPPNDGHVELDGTDAGARPAAHCKTNTTANQIVQFDVGFSAGGGEIVANGNIAASDEGSLEINQRIDDFDAVDTIFLDANNWNGTTLIIYIKMSRIF